MQIISLPKGTWKEHIQKAKKSLCYENSSEVLPVCLAQLPKEPIKSQISENIFQELAICLLLLPSKKEKKVDEPSDGTGWLAVPAELCPDQKICKTEIRD